MDNREALLRRLRSVAAIVLIALYAAGLVAMLMSNVRVASILWTVSTLGGIGLLYWMRTVTKRREEAAKEASGDNTKPGD